ncbi:MAG: hypothetical protein ACM3KM_02025 [Acidobacteriaceae bacterium]
MTTRQRRNLVVGAVSLIAIVFLYFAVVRPWLSKESTGAVVQKSALTADVKTLAERQLEAKVASLESQIAELTQKNRVQADDIKAQEERAIKAEDELAKFKRTVATTGARKAGVRAPGGSVTVAEDGHKINRHYGTMVVR